MTNSNFDYVNNYTPEVGVAMDYYAASLGEMFAAEEALNVAKEAEETALAEADAASLLNHTQEEYQYYHRTVVALCAAEDATSAARTNYDAACAACLIQLDNLLAAEAAVLYNLYWDAQLTVYAAEEAEEAALAEADAASLLDHTREEYQYYQQTVVKLRTAEEAVIAACELLVVAAVAASITK